MKTLLPWFLFAVSVAFNVFFVVGMSYGHRGRSGRPGPEERTALLHRKLDLDEAQKTAILELERKSEEERSRIDAERGSRFDALMKELVKDKPDEAVISEFVKTGNSAQRLQRFVDHVRSVMKVLRPEQREKAVELFRRPSDSRKAQ